MSKLFTAHRPKPARIGARPGAGAGAMPKPAAPEPADPARPPERPREIGGPGGPEPTRYGDWERNGICVDF